MMQEMKDSGIKWIGEIPADWELNKIKYIASSVFQGNGITKEDVVEEGDTFCVRYGEIYTKYNFSFRDCVTKTNEKLISPRRYFCHGDILFVGTGESVEEIGKNVAYLGDEKCLAGGDIIVVQHNQDPAFLSYAMNSSYAQAQKSYGKAKLKVVHISPADIGNLIVLLPPLAEQQAIAAFLDTKCARLDSIIDDLERQIEILQEYKKSVITHAVTKGLNPAVPMKDSGVDWIGEIPAHWETKRLKYIGSAQNGLTYEPSDITFDEGTLVLRSSNIQDGKLDLNDTIYVSCKIPTSIILHKQDILLCSRNGSRRLIGKCILIDERVEGETYGAFMCVFRSEHNRFLHYVFQSEIFNYYLATFLTSTVNQLTNSNLLSMVVPITFDKNEQNKIVDYLNNFCSKTDMIIAEKKKSLSVMQENKASIIYEYVTGKKRVKEAAIHAD